MKILYNFNELSHILEISYILDDDDMTEYINSENLVIKFSKHNCKFVLPDNFKRKHLYNDCVALCALLLVYPFIGNRIVFEFSISDVFAKTLDKSGKKIMYLRDGISKAGNRTVSNGIHAINFNTTIESIALTELSEDNTLLTHFDIGHNLDYQYLLMDMTYSKGKQIVTVKNNSHEMFTEIYKQKSLKHNRVPFDLAEYIPIILLSELYNIKYLQFNFFIRDIEQLEMSSNQLVYHRTARWKFYNTNNNYKNINRFSYWRDLFTSVGLTTQCPLAGITRMGIYKILKHNFLFKHLPICNEGFIDSKCKRCKNCLIHTWMNWYYNDKPLQFDMDKLKSCKIIYAYTLFFYKETEHLRVLYETLKKRYPELDRQMHTLQTVRKFATTGDGNLFQKLKTFGIDKFSSLI